jgi:hypothetical protein
MIDDALKLNVDVIFPEGVKHDREQKFKVEGHEDNKIMWK